MDEVDAATQAEMALKLSDNVRDLVRKHMKEALEDPEFTQSLHIHHLSKVITHSLNANEYSFQQAVRSVIVNQMNKF